jgi:hypothetical protein
LHHFRQVLLTAALTVAAIQASAKTPERIFEEASRSVVVIRAYSDDGHLLRNQGSGVVVAKEGVVTNCHVVEEAKRIVIVNTGREFDAKVEISNLERDLCYLAVPHLALPPAPLASGAVKVGQRVYAVGAPEGLELSISEGLVSSIREFEGSQYIQTSAPISGGSSGGGLFDTEARLVGLTAFFLPEGQNINFALPVAWVSELLARDGRSVALAHRDAGAARWQARADELREKGDGPALLAWSQQWVRSMPTHLAAWLQLGDAYRSVNRPRRAVTAYQQALRLDARSFEVWLNLAAAYQALHQYDRAVDTLEEALRVRPDDVAALAALGAAYRGLNQREKVRDIHAALAKIDPAAAREYARKYMNR